MTAEIVRRRTKNARTQLESFAEASTVAYRQSLLRRAAWVTVCLKVTLVSLVFDPFAFYAFAQPKTLMSNASDYILVALLATTLLYHGRAALRGSPLHAPVVALGAAFLVAAAFALDRRVAVFGAPDRNLGLLSTLDGVLLYAAVVLLLRERRDLLMLMVSLGVSAVAVTAYEGIQMLDRDPIAWVSDHPLFSTLGNRDVIGQFLGTLATAFAAVTFAPHRTPSKVRLLSAGIAIIALAGGLLSGSRALGIGVVFGAAFLIAVRVLTVRSARSRLLTVLASAGLVIGIAGAALFTPAGQRISDLFKAVGTVETRGLTMFGPAVIGRLDLYRAGFEIWTERPLVGVGPDNFAVAYPAHRTQSSHEFQVATAQTSVHSLLGKLATDAGVLGLLAFAEAFAISILLASRSRRDTAAFAGGAALMSFVGTGLVSIDHVATAWMPWLAMGLIAASSREARPAVDADATSPRRGRVSRARSGRMVLISAAIMCLGVFLAGIAIKNALTASHAAQTARVAISGGKAGGLEVGIAAARRATDLDPERPEYWDELAQAQFQRGDMREAARAWTRAASLAFFQSEYRVNVAKAQLNLGYMGDLGMRQAALSTARAVAKDDPYVADVQYVLALAMSANGAPTESVDAAERFLQLGGKPDPLLAKSTAGAYLDLGRLADAGRWLSTILRDDRVSEADLRVLFAQALAREGRIADAIRQLDLVLRADPTNEAAARLKRELAD